MARETLEDEWASAHKAEALIYNSAALGGYHIAEKLGIPGGGFFPYPALFNHPRIPKPILPVCQPGSIQQAEPPPVCRPGTADVPPPDR
jgi:hypothetical protein